MYPFFYHDIKDDILYDLPNIEELAKKDASIVPKLLEAVTNVKGFLVADIFLNVSK